MEIQGILSELVHEGLVCLQKPELLLKALDCYAQTSFDFVDCLLWAYHKVEQVMIFTFDQKLKKYIKESDC